MLQSGGLVKLPKWRGMLFRIFFKFVVCLQRLNVSAFLITEAVERNTIEQLAQRITSY